MLTATTICAWTIRPTKGVNVGRTHVCLQRGRPSLPEKGIVLPFDDRIRVDILASGSKGNAALLRSPQTTLLIDAGLTYRALTQRLELVDCAMSQVQAVLISHAHSDHIRAIKLMSRRADLDLMASEACLKQIPLSSKQRCALKTLQPQKPYLFGDLKILPLATAHDAAGSLAFRVDVAGGPSFGWATDLGKVDAALLEGLGECAALGLEANHDREMLQQGPYPWFLKKRVASEKGHLSNAQSAELLRRLMHPGLRQVAALHLSEKNNQPALALQALQEVVAAAETKVLVQQAAQSEILRWIDWPLSRARIAAKKPSNNMPGLQPIL